MTTKSKVNPVEFETDTLKAVKPPARLPGKPTVKGVTKPQPGKMPQPKTQPIARPRLQSGAGKDWDCTIADVLGRDLLIEDAHEIKTQYGKAYTITATVLDSDQTLKILVGGVALVRTIDDLMENGGIPDGGIETRAIRAEGERYFIFE